MDYQTEYDNLIEMALNRETPEGYTEAHHIRPVAMCRFAKRSKKENKNYVWDCNADTWAGDKSLVDLTGQEHYYAHYLLAMIYPDNRAAVGAWWAMCNQVEGRYYEVDADRYQLAKELHAKNVSELQREVQRKRIENGTHHLLGGEFQREMSRKRIENGTHHFLDGEFQREMSRKRIENGTHHFLGGEFQREVQRKRIENGTHHFLGGEHQRKRVENGTHNLLGKSTYKNVETGELNQFPSGEQPDGWVSHQMGTAVYKNIETGEKKTFPSGEQPDGWVGNRAKLHTHTHTETGDAGEFYKGYAPEGFVLVKPKKVTEKKPNKVGLASNVLSLDGEIIAFGDARVNLLKQSTEVTLYESQKGLSKTNLDWLLKARPDAQIIPWEEHQGSWQNS
jgi:hypothetical protein